MSKTQRKSRSELEHLKGEVKRLKSVNRQLRKKLKEFQNRAHFYENVVDTVIEENDADVAIETCNHCGKGEFFVVDLKFVKYKICNVCDHRKKV